MNYFICLTGLCALSSFVSTYAFLPRPLFSARKCYKKVPSTVNNSPMMMMVQPPSNPNKNSQPIYIPDPMPSIFTEGIPAGLKGEAVRSALVDKNKGLWYELGNPSTFQAGILHVKGPGTLPFLHSKFTSAFEVSSFPDYFQNSSPTATELNNKGLVRKTCFLTAKGRTIDIVSVLYNQKLNRSTTLSFGKMI